MGISETTPQKKKPAHNRAGSLVSMPTPLVAAVRLALVKIKNLRRARGQIKMPIEKPRRKIAHDRYSQ